MTKNNWAEIWLSDPRLGKAAVLADNIGQKRVLRSSKAHVWPVLFEAEGEGAIPLICADILQTAAGYARTTSRPLTKDFKMANFLQEIHRELGPEIGGMVEKFGVGYGHAGSRKLYLASAISDLRLDIETVWAPVGGERSVVDAHSDARMTQAEAIEFCNKRAREAHDVFKRCEGSTSPKLEALFREVFEDNRALAAMKRFEKPSPPASKPN